MAEESDHTRHLIQARDKLVEERRALATTLLEPYKAGRSEDMQERFSAVQATIEAIDRAIADERGIAEKTQAPSVQRPRLSQPSPMGVNGE